MTISGKWNLDVKTPRGKQKGALNLVEDGNGVTGTMKMMSQTYEIDEGEVDGNKITYMVNVKKPIPLKIRCEMEVDGDNMKGKLDFGPLGKGLASGTRV